VSPKMEAGTSHVQISNQRTNSAKDKMRPLSLFLLPHINNPAPKVNKEPGISTGGDIAPPDNSGVDPQLIAIIELHPVVNSLYWW